MAVAARGGRGGLALVDGRDPPVLRHHRPRRQPGRRPHQYRRRSHRGRARTLLPSHSRRPRAPSRDGSCCWGRWSGSACWRRPPGCRRPGAQTRHLTSRWAHHAPEPYPFGGEVSSAIRGRAAMPRTGSAARHGEHRGTLEARRDDGRARGDLGTADAGPPLALHDQAPGGYRSSRSRRRDATPSSWSPRAPPDSSCVRRR